MKLLDKYQPYLVSYTMPGVQPRSYDLTAEGWNFDFVPKGRNASWARTDKSIYTHVYELSPDFYDISREHDKIKKQARDRTIMDSWYIDIKHPEKRLQDKIHQHITVFLHLLPLITEYYRATASYEGLLKRIEDEFEDGYYRFINGEDIVISKVFVEKRMGVYEKALEDFEAIPFKNDTIKNAYYNKLIQLEGA